MELLPLQLAEERKSTLTSTADSKLEGDRQVLTLQTGVTGAFLALDLFLFFVFWEVSLVPMYFLVGIWGDENRRQAAIKFFVYTFLGSTAMLAGFNRLQ